MRKLLRTILFTSLLAVGGLGLTSAAEAQRFGISLGGGRGGWGGGGWGGHRGGGPTIDFGFGHYHLGSNRFHLGSSYSHRPYYGYGQYGTGASPYYGYQSYPYYGSQSYPHYGQSSGYSQGYTMPYSSASAPPVSQTPAYEGKGLVLWNPVKNGKAITFQIDGQPYTLEPGYQVTLTTQPEWTVAYESENERSVAEYLVRDGKSYTFHYSDASGWELNEAQ